MRKAIFFLLACCTLFLQAAPIDILTAQKTASSFFAKKGKQLAPTKRAHKAPRKQQTSTPVREAAYYYVFNAEKNGG